MITQEQIEQIIREEVKVDIYEDLYNVDRAAEVIKLLIDVETRRLKEQLNAAYGKLTEQSWIINPDRMGGQFTDEELSRRDTWI